MGERLHYADIDLVRELGENAAPRPCQYCNDPDSEADYYVFEDKTTSVFACERHLDDALTEARR